MAADYVKETPNYVRGTLEDSIRKVKVCEMCGTVIDNQVGCHYQCKGCGNHVTCSD